MFDLAWSEIALIGIVALIAIGPKDLPVAIKAVGEMIKKARRMASEFQTHVDEMVRDADLKDVKDTFNDLRRMDIKGKILNAVDSDGTLRKTVEDTRFDFNPAPPPVPVPDIAPLPETAVAALPEHTIAAPTIDAPPRDERPPAFLPPQIAAAGLPAPPPPPPAFVPPQVVALAAGARRPQPYA